MSERKEVDISKYQQRSDKDKKKPIVKKETSKFLKDFLKRLKEKKENRPIRIDLDGKQGGDFNIEF